MLIDHYHQLLLKPSALLTMNGNASQGEELFVDPVSLWVLALDLTLTLPLPVGCRDSACCCPQPPIRAPGNTCSLKTSP